MDMKQDIADAHAIVLGLARMMDGLEGEWASDARYYVVLASLEAVERRLGSVLDGRRV